MRANAKLRAVLRLLLALVIALGAVRRSSRVLGRRAALRVLGLTPARVREWERRVPDLHPP